LPAYRFHIRFLLLLGALVIRLTVAAQEYTQNELKAGYIINFSKFVEWPTEYNNGPFIVGIYGPDPFEEFLGKMLETRKGAQRLWLIEHYNNISELKYCHILFITEAADKDLAEILKFSQDKAILTIGNSINGFCEKGGIINFTAKESAKRFQINQDSGLKVKLKIDSRLLSLSEIIKASP